jgi:hypothetical protein
MELSPHPNDIRVRLFDMIVPWQTTRPIVKDVVLTEIVIRDVRNWVFFHPLLRTEKEQKARLGWGIFPM